MRRSHATKNGSLFHCTSLRTIIMV